MRHKLLRSCAVAIGAAGFTLGITSTSALAATQTSLHVTLRHSLVEAVGRMWTDSGGGQHARNVHVTDQLVQGSAVVGTMSRYVNYNLWPARDYASRAWCDLHMDLGTLGQYDGSCAGSLMSGKFTAHGAGGSTLSGTYALKPGGTLGVGPYVLDMTVDQRGS